MVMNKNKESLRFIQALSDLIVFDLETGLPRWFKKSSKYSNIKIGDIAGCVKPNGYRYITIMIGKQSRGILTHRLAWYMNYGSLPDSQIDHENLDKDDNRISNLRLATHQENQYNKRKQKFHNGKSTSSQYKGVTKRGNSWEAGIRKNGRWRYLGSFSSELKAAEARKEASRKLHGQFYNTD